ncbi:MAG: hypothetical protein ABI925_12415 [Verrucomicrobiota bacterium]
MPEDLAESLGRKESGHAKGEDEKKTMHEIQSRFSECAEENLRKGWLIATGWKSETELTVVEEFAFFHVIGQVAVTRTYKINGTEVTMTEEKIVKTTKSIVP